MRQIRSNGIRSKNLIVCLLVVALFPIPAVALLPGPGSARWEQTLHDIPAPELHVFSANVAASSIPVAFSTMDFTGMDIPNETAEAYFIPQDFRKYQNSHIAPTRIYVGSAAVAVGGAMMIAGYKQDNKYEWSGPYMSPSPLNVFGILIIAVGVGFIVSGLIFYSKFKKHTIMPYNKSY